jgi:dihydroorotate dehydrogenase
MYRLLFRLVFKRINPELTHELGAGLMRALVALRLLRPAKSGRAVTVAGLKLENRLGLAAGFDKNAELVRAAYALGFGHVEVGTVTALAQPGNPKPRLFRLTKDRALINRMGFNNHGAIAVANRLRALRASGAPLPVIGVNIGKSRAVELTDAAADYAFSAERLAPLADYLAVNVSSPNTPGLRDLQQVSALRPILRAVLAVSGETPVFLKIAPDLQDQDVLDCVALARELKLAGLILANTTIAREGLESAQQFEAGGLSGAPLKSRAIELLQLVKPAAAGLTLISVGGIETEAEARQRIELGAELVQSYTGFVYGGPLWPKRLAAGLRA